MPSWRIQKTYPWAGYAITEQADLLYEFDRLPVWAVRQKVMPDDHSKLVPLLPIPNRTVKRLSADDSADSRVKVGHRQALTVRNAQLVAQPAGLFFCELCCFFVWFIVDDANKKPKIYLTGDKKPVYNLRLSWLQLTTKKRADCC
jgi:hypothetical protein